MQTAAAAAAGAASQEALVPRVEIFLAARGLPDLDRTSKTDPFAVLYTRATDGSLTEVDRTETIDDTLDPRWTKQFSSDYYFETVQPFVVRVYDQDKKGGTLGEQQYIGEAAFELGNALGPEGMLETPVLDNGNSRGTLVVHAQMVVQNNQFLRVKMDGHKLANKDGLFGRSDPFITANRASESGAYVRVWQSEVVDNNLNPSWKAALLSVQRLCNGDVMCPLRWEIYDHDSDGSHDYMGAFEASVTDIVGHAGSSFRVVDNSKGKRKHCGDVRITSAELFEQPTMLGYIAGGCEISLTVAIDFTGSNGDPNTPGTLHHLDPSGATFNQYETAITGVGAVLEQYDTDKRFPVFGFGARPGTGPVDHCMRLFGESEMQGVEGIMMAYHAAVTQLHFSGPTLFAPVLRAAMAEATACTQEVQKYHVLLIICDGIINDMDTTVDLLVQASRMPLSIVIVGVGQADFTDMERLDGDDGVLRSSDGQAAARDIVQFVKMSDFPAGESSRLASEVLREIPAQLTSYMSLASVRPNPPPPPYMEAPLEEGKTG